MCRLRTAQTTSALRSIDDEWRQIFDGCKHLPGDQYYDFVWPEGTPVKGCASSSRIGLERSLSLETVLGSGRQGDPVFSPSGLHRALLDAVSDGQHLAVAPEVDVGRGDVAQ